MKKVSVMIPCYNEKENIIQITDAVEKQLRELPQYDYEILIIDNCSTDGTRELIRNICAEHSKIKAILNIKNFGQFNSPFYGLCQTSGDCAIAVCADFQDPVELIPVFLQYWEEGYQIVCGVKKTSRENKLIFRLRGLYYRVIKKFSSIDMIEQFTGFGLYDKSFINVLKNLDDPTPFIRGIVAELGGKRKEIPYEQPERRAGKTHNGWYSLFDAAMLSFTSYTKVGMRVAEFVGFCIAVISMIIGIVYLIMKLVNWDQFNAGQAPLIIVTTIIGSILLAFMGFLGEYISAVNTRLMHRPLVIEEERINFDNKQ